jgi:hypothetical protein
LVIKFIPHVIPHPYPSPAYFFGQTGGFLAGEGRLTERGLKAPSLNSLPLSNMLKNGQFISLCLRGVHPEGSP